MNSLRAMKIVVALAFGAALPTVLAIAYYFSSGDPTLRPLGISKAALDRFTPANSELDVVIAIGWGEEAQLRQDRDEVGELIGRSVAAYDVAYRVEHFTIKGDDVLVWYVVRKSRIGPYPVSQAAKGVSAAIAAIKLNMRASGMSG